MNPYGWNLNPMASYPSEQLNSVRRWNIPPYDDQFRPSRERHQKTAEKCQQKIKYLIDKYKDAESWNKSQTEGHIRKSVFYDKID